jgi:hypothetical protein
MTALRLVAIAILLTAASVHAQSPGEIAFWESVRESRNPAELQAYIDQFPNGTFVVLARSRLAALRKPAAAPAARPTAPPPTPVVAASAPANRLPSAGDTWTYRMSYPRLRGQWGQAARPPSTHVVKADMASETEIVEQLAIDGGTAANILHGRGGYLLAEGAAIYSPYLIAFDSLTPGARLGRAEMRIPACGTNYRCEASARVAGRETIAVPAGRFETIKVVIEHQWTPFTAFSTTGSSAADMTGGRELTVWYSPQVKRAVKYSSRLVAGAVPPVEANFDLELTDYKVN